MKEQENLQPTEGNPFKGSTHRKSLKLMRLGKSLYFLLGLSIFVLVVFLVWRVYFSDRLPKSMESLSPNEILCNAYEENGNLTLITQNQYTITQTEENYGYFSVARFVFIKEADQLQLVFRYNNSTLERITERLGLSEQLPRGEEIFDVSVVTVRDLTPDNTEDNADGNENIAESRVLPTSVKIETSKLYTYFYYTFDGVELSNDLLAVYFDIYYGETPDYTESPLGTLRLYHNESKNVYIKLSRKEKKAIAAFDK